MIAENLHIIREKVFESCRRAGRNPEEIKIITVSKNTGLGLINEALECGLTEFGENKARELTEKSELLRDRKINWHFIGHLQTNKVRPVVEAALLIHSVDSLRLAAEIDKQAAKLQKRQQVLIEVKTADDGMKTGINNLEELLQVAEFCRQAENIELTGLMTMAPYSDDEKIVRKSFLDLNKYKVILNERNFSITELSMGMTHDYQWAIEEGATMLRLGTAIFGERDYSKSWKEQ